MNPRFIPLLFFLFSLPGCRAGFPELYEKALENFSRGNYVDAADQLNLGLSRWTASEGEEAKAQAYQLLGKSYHKLHKRDKPAEAFEQAIRLSTNTFDSAYALGIISLASSKPQAAAKAFQDALRMKRDDPLALVGLGNALYALKEYKAAQEHYRRVLDTSPGVREALEALNLVEKKLQSPAPRTTKNPPSRSKGSLRLSR